MAKTDPAWNLFVGELAEKLCLSMASTDVRKLSGKLKDLADALKKANDEKSKPGGKKAGKAKPNLVSWERENFMFNVFFVKKHN